MQDDKTLENVKLYAIAANTCAWKSAPEKKNVALIRFTDKGRRFVCLFVRPYSRCDLKIEKENNQGRRVAVYRLQIESTTKAKFSKSWLVGNHGPLQFTDRVFHPCAARNIL